ncbi:MAG TPA: PaaX family transcriptional regulator C-terminal domain-containing protein [Streptosporangiaceae bacterium]|nr:PaaX family transcriptional regulator C-terminal domain-containing protein [Streptosporangiaceae bacterium]
MATDPTFVQDAHPDLQPRQLIVTLYGLYARDEHNWLSVAALVRLMSELGVDGQAVRSSVSRLKRRDTLRSRSVAGAAGYSLSPASLEVLREGDARIFHTRRATLADGWVVVVFSVPESEREKRHELRTRLSRLGFGTVAPGVWVAPAQLAQETATVLARSGLERYAEMFRGDHLGFAGLTAKVNQWWDLDELAAQSAEFTARFRPVADRLAVRRASDSEAFRQYVPMLTTWRRLPYLDPGLPLELLPAGWGGETASALFAELNGELREPARRHAMAVIHA